MSQRLEARSRRVGVPGGELFVSQIGSGPVMVTLHGSIGLDHWQLRPWLDPLAECCRVVYFDQRGHGASSRPERWAEVEHATYVADVEALREHLSADRIFLFGHSYGGHIAVEYALRHPTRVAGLLLCSTSACVDYGEQIVRNAASRGGPMQGERVRQILSGPLANDAEWEKAFREILPLYFHDISVLQGTRLFDDGTFSVDAFNRAYFHCLSSYNVLPRLSEISAPTLVLSGDDDWVTPLELTALPLRYGIPHAELVVFERCGHFPFVEAHERFCEVVTEWMRRIGPSALSPAGGS